jgi:hypothetical protein
LAPGPPVHKTDGQSTKPKVTGSNPVGRAPSAHVFACKPGENSSGIGIRLNCPNARFGGFTPSETIAQTIAQTPALRADRLHPLIPREARRWRKLYRGRAAVEREFGRLKNDWALLPLRVRGWIESRSMPT